jgi:hypothetical protein
MYIIYFVNHESQDLEILPGFNFTKPLLKFLRPKRNYAWTTRSKPKQLKAQRNDMEKEWEEHPSHFRWAQGALLLEKLPPITKYYTANALLALSLIPGSPWLRQSKSWNKAITHPSETSQTLTMIGAELGKARNVKNLTNAGTPAYSKGKRKHYKWFGRTYLQKSNYKLITHCMTAVYGICSKY